MTKTAVFWAKIKGRYRAIFSDRGFVVSLILSAVLLFVSLLVNFYAAIYALERESSSVKDIILSNLPVINLDFFVVYGPVFMWLFVVVLCLLKPQKIPFTLKSVALFLLIRSVFITLTHIGPFPDHINIDYSLDIVKLFTTGGDLFFSGHTGLPFLLAFVYGKHNHFLRWLFVFTAVFFGIVVLLAHIHYSIDVLSAFFITYTIYVLAEKFFPWDVEYFWQ